MADVLDDNFEAEVEAFFRDSFEKKCKERYEWAHRQMGIAIETAYEDLAEEQKQKVRDEVRRYDEEMRQLGADITSGKLKTGLTAAVIASNL